MGPWHLLLIGVATATAGTWLYRSYRWTLLGDDIVLLAGVLCLVTGFVEISISLALLTFPQ